MTYKTKIKKKGLDLKHDPHYQAYLENKKENEEYKKKREEIIKKYNLKQKSPLFEYLTHGNHWGLSETRVYISKNKELKGKEFFIKGDGDFFITD